MFDHALSGNVSQNVVSATCALPLLELCLDGYNATVLAYGQTGAGIIPCAFQDLFVRPNEHKQQEHHSSFEFQVHIQFSELYGEEIWNLLASTMMLNGGSPTMRNK
eukprot:4169468-Ditylum_brightwellii.AAC.1